MNFWVQKLENVLSVNEGGFSACTVFYVCPEVACFQLDFKS